MKHQAPGPTRELSPRHLQIADGIGRGLSYAEIAGELTRITGKPVALDTIRAHMRVIAARIPEPAELPPRWRVYLWVKQREWASAARPSPRRRLR